MLNFDELFRAQENTKKYLGGIEMWKTVEMRYESGHPIYDEERIFLLLNGCGETVLCQSDLDKYWQYVEKGLISKKDFVWLDTKKVPVKYKDGIPVLLGKSNTILVLSADKKRWKTAKILNEEELKLISSIYQDCTLYWIV